MFDILAIIVLILFFTICAKFLLIEGYRGIKRGEINILKFIFWFPYQKEFGKKAKIIGYSYILLGLYTTYFVITLIAALFGWGNW